jgi:hypothetical protein
VEVIPIAHAPITEHTDVLSISMNSNQEAVKKEDSMLSPYFLETKIARFNPQNQASSVILQLGFCCKNPITKLVAVNHTTELFDCHKDRCPRKLIKVSIGEWS